MTTGSPSTYCPSFLFSELGVFSPFQPTNRKAKSGGKGTFWETVSVNMEQTCHLSLLSTPRACNHPSSLQMCVGCMIVFWLFFNQRNKYKTLTILFSLFG